MANIFEVTDYKLGTNLKMLTVAAAKYLLKSQNKNKKYYLGFMFLRLLNTIICYTISY